MIEVWIARLGGAAGLATLGAALWGLARARHRPAGRIEGPAGNLLRWPILGAATLLYLVILILLWRPLPIELRESSPMALVLLGAAIYFPSLGLYLWGLRALGPVVGAA